MKDSETKKYCYVCDREIMPGKEIKLRDPETLRNNLLSNGIDISQIFNRDYISPAVREQTFFICGRASCKRKYKAKQHKVGINACPMASKKQRGRRYAKTVPHGYL